MVDISTDDHWVGVTVDILKADGTPATVEGPLVWATADATIVDFRDIAADGMSIGSVEPLLVGSAAITVTGDADLGSGVVPIIGTETINVTQGTRNQAASLVIKLGAAVPKP